MKYWNKTKEVRLRCWYKISLTRNTSLVNTRSYSGWTRIDSFDSVKRKLQNHHSNGKFFMSLGIREIWFELQEDAVWFSLSLGDKV